MILTTETFFIKSSNDEGGSVSDNILVDQPPSSFTSANKRANDQQPTNIEESTSEVVPINSNGETNPSEALLKRSLLPL